MALLGAITAGYGLLWKALQRQVSEAIKKGHKTARLWRLLAERQNGGVHSSPPAPEWEEDTKVRAKQLSLDTHDAEMLCELDPLLREYLKDSTPPSRG